MLQKGCMPSFAMPPENVAACPSAMPTSNARSGMDFINRFMEHPVGMAGVTPTIFGFFSASSTSVSPNTVWYRGGRLLVSVVMRSPVSGSNLPGACQMPGSFSAGSKPLPFTVCRWSILGPFKSLMSRRMRARFFTSCPFMGPK